MASASARARHAPHWGSSVGRRGRGLTSALRVPAGRRRQRVPVKDRPFRHDLAFPERRRGPTVSQRSLHPLGRGGLAGDCSVRDTWWTTSHGTWQQVCWRLGVESLTRQRKSAPPAWMEPLSAGEVARPGGIGLRDEGRSKQESNQTESTAEGRAGAAGSTSPQRKAGCMPDDTAVTKMPG